MAKQRTAYVCSECGYDTPKWVGRCPSCGEWNTFKEMKLGNDLPSKGAAAVAVAGLHRAGA